MPPKFGTSGLRGLVADLSRDLVGRHVAAFLSACPHGGRVLVGRDLRPSSPRIAGDVIAAVRAAGVRAADCGAVPTPALAQAAIARGAAAIMVTGSHIPADRNGLKFYVPGGEITKADEARITAAVDRGAGADGAAAAPGGLERVEGVGTDWTDRVARAFRPGALAGRRIGVYRHSSVARDLLEQALAALGAECVPLGHSDEFVPVDTEAVDPATRRALAGWCAEHRLDAVASTDGDGDRPMLADATGRVVPGDLLGLLTARAVGAGLLVTPVSSNDAVAGIGLPVRRTRIGSPHVIAAMEAALAEDRGARVAGFEANGGFLLGFEAGPCDGGPGAGTVLAASLPALMTRDALLPVVAPLAAAGAGGLGAALAALPPRAALSDRLTGIDRARGAALIGDLEGDAGALAAFVGGDGPIASVDGTDGLRVGLADGSSVHLRLSGNAPEFRVYAQAATEAAARALLERHLARVAERIGGG